MSLHVPRFHVSSTHLQTLYGCFPKLGNKDYNTFGSILGFPYFGELPYNPIFHFIVHVLLLLIVHDIPKDRFPFKSCCRAAKILLSVKATEISFRLLRESTRTPLVPLMGDIWSLIVGT